MAGFVRSGPCAACRCAGAGGSTGRAARPRRHVLRLRVQARGAATDTSHRVGNDRSRCACAGVAQTDDRRTEDLTATRAARRRGRPFRCGLRVDARARRSCVGMAGWRGSPRRRIAVAQARWMAGRGPLPVAAERTAGAYLCRVAGRLHGWTLPHGGHRSGCPDAGGSGARRVMHPNAGPPAGEDRRTVARVHCTCGLGTRA